MSAGWIKLHRQIQDCCIWQTNEPFDKRSAWIDLLLSANHSDKKIIFNGSPIVIKRGQYLTSIRKLSAKWNWSVNRTYRFIKLLEEEKMLQKESDKDRTLITIENYGLYQDSENTNENTDEYTNENSSGNTDEYTDRTPTDTLTEHKQEYKNNKNEKECKNERIKDSNTPPLPPSQGEEENEIPKNESYKHLFERILQRYTISEYLLEAIRDWLKYKYNERHFKYKEVGMNTLLKQVSKNSEKYGDEAVRTAIYESIASGYQGIVWDRLELRGKSNGTYHNRTAEMLQDSYNMMSEWVRKKEMEESENDN